MAASPSDEDLMDKVRAGDQQAFTLLVNRHLPQAYAIARRVLGRQADAEDVAQEAFTRVWTHACDWQPQRGSFSAWLGRILVNASLDHARRQAPQRFIDDADVLLADLADPSATPAVRHSQLQAAAAVDKAVAHLPDRQRMAVVLCYFEEHSNPQAAQMMGLHVKALEGLLVRARKQLRGWLGKYREEP